MTATETPIVSVVIPTHNRAVLLVRALASVRAQSYTHLEILVIDDASTDATGDIVQTIADPRIRYIRHERNRGGSAARNTGVRAATGEYIAFLDDDDEWLPHKTERQLQLLQHYDAVLCSSDAAAAQDAAAGVRTLSARDFLGSPFAVGGTGVLMARAHVLKETPFDESLPRAQDWDLFIRIASKYRIAYTDERLLRYNEGEHPRISNAIVGLPVEELEKRLVMLDKHKDFFGPRWYRRHLGAMLIYGIKYRRDKLRHLIYTVRRCGVAATSEILMERVRQKLRQRKRPIQRLLRPGRVADNAGRDG